MTRHNRDKPHGDMWSRWQAAQRLGPDSGVLTGAVGESRREWWPHLSPSVPESPYEDHVWLVVLLGEPSITCSWWLALPLALCPAPPCPLRVGLCLYALPVLPQEVRAKAGPTLPPLPFLESGVALPVHLSLARNNHLWRAGGCFGAGWGLELRADASALQAAVHSEGLSRTFPCSCSNCGSLWRWWSWGRTLLLFYYLTYTVYF